MKMDSAQVKMKTKVITTLFLLALSLNDVVKANPEYTLHEGSSAFEGVRATFVALEHGRYRRDTAATPTATSDVTPASNASAPVPNAANATVTNNTTSINGSVIQDASSTPPTMVTKTPLLLTSPAPGRGVKLADSVPKVSDPILPDDDLSEVFKETPETIKAEQNLGNLTYDTHNFYNSSFIGNLTYFNEYWANITKPKALTHEVLSNSHRRATAIELKFDFPFYGHNVRNITVATGGFIYTGDHVHNWLAATQYIAPLMANFDTSATNDSVVKLYDDGTKFTVFWENATLKEDLYKTFTFAVTLYNNGDIVFAYKNIPIPVQNINDVEHPVKVGISDAYLSDKILFYVRRKTIYEYHRVSFKNYEISNNTILKLVALPTCLQYHTCESCINHQTGFDCLWCEQLHKCSSGTDRNKQDWVLRACNMNPISNVSACPAPDNEPPADTDASKTAYTTDNKSTYHEAVVKTVHTDEVTKTKMPAAETDVTAAGRSNAYAHAHSPIGGAVAAFLTVTMVCCLAAWLLYAFKNPHTRSGQLLIKYRPSQWSWRRGEARYTAATIHM